MSHFEHLFTTGCFCWGLAKISLSEPEFYFFDDIVCKNKSLSHPTPHSICPQLEIVIIATVTATKPKRKGGAQTPGRGTHSGMIFGAVSQTGEQRAW